MVFEIAAGTAGVRHRCERGKIRRTVGRPAWPGLVLVVAAALACLATAPSEAKMLNGKKRSWGYVTGSLVNVRQSPHLTAKLETSFVRGTLLRILGERGKWAKIQHPRTKIVGWMHTDFIKLVPKPTEAAVAPPGAMARRSPEKEPNATTGVTVGGKQNHRMFVYGDSLATNLFEGLQSISARAGFYTVSRRTRGATGLVRSDEYDWFAFLKRHLPKDRPDIAVVTFGGNDRQDFQDRVHIRRFTPSWWHVYRARVEQMMLLLKRYSRQVYWLGLPVLHSKRMTRDYQKFNAVYRQTAERLGIIYVETWTTFQSPDGGYTGIGPGIDGNRVQLRHPDGIHFSHEGCQVLGQRVVDEIRRTFQRERISDQKTAGQNRR